MTDYIFNPLPLMRMEVHSGVVSLILLYIVHLVFNYDERQLNSAVLFCFKYGKSGNFSPHSTAKSK